MSAFWVLLGLSISLIFVEGWLLIKQKLGCLIPLLANPTVGLVLLVGSLAAQRYEFLVVSALWFASLAIPALAVLWAIVKSPPDWYEFKR